MIILRILRLVVCCAAVLLTVIPNAVAAEDKLILAVAHYGEWESAAALLGQQAGIFKKHGLTLRFLPTRDSKETEQLVLSGKADVGTGVNVMEVMHSYAFGAPLRVIGAQMAGSINYWYVPRSSPIKSFKNIACLSGCHPQPLAVVFGHAHGRSPAWQSSVPTIAARVPATFP